MKMEMKDPSIVSTDQNSSGRTQCEKIASEQSEEENNLKEKNSPFTKGCDTESSFICSFFVFALLQMQSLQEYQ